MALTMTPVTELDAVNMMLMSIGQSPVNSVTATGIKDVATALLVLHNTSRAAQDEGWDFNTDYAFPITPDGNQRILVPSNTMNIDPIYDMDNFVQRWDEENSAMSMWNLEAQTFDREGILYCDIVRFYAFEKTPQSFRNYAALLAGQRFQAGAISSELLFRFEEKDVSRARAILERNTNRQKDRNFFNNTSDFTSQIFHRRRNP